MMKLTSSLATMILLLGLISNALATISLYDIGNSIITTIDNTDILYASGKYTQLTGTIGVAAFEDPETGNVCKLKLPTNYTVLLVPLQGLMAAGCGVDSVVIVANKFMMPSSNLPGVVVFMSTNGGEPGNREYVQGSILDLASSIPGVTLVTAMSFIEILSILKNVSHVTITADKGPWDALRYSTTLNVYCITFAVIYGSMIIICSVLAIKVFMGTEAWLPTQQRFWMYFGIIYCFTGVTIRLTINHADLSDDLPFWLSYAVLLLSAYTFIAVVYVFVLHSWVELCSKINVGNNSRVIPRLAIVFRAICVIANVLFILTFILATIDGTISPLPSWFLSMYNIIIILKYIFWVLVPAGFLIFGTILVSFLQRAGPTRSRKMSRKIFILMITMGTSQILWFAANYVIQNMAVTVINFWIGRISGDITNILSSIVIILVLRQPNLVSDENSQQSSKSSKSGKSSKSRQTSNQDQLDLTVGSKRHTWTKMDDIELRTPSQSHIMSYP